jgi:CHAT domain-containing protein/Tfp pilus assembly protein PilF
MLARATAIGLLLPFIVLPQQVAASRLFDRESQHIRASLSSGDFQTAAREAERLWATTRVGWGSSSLAALRAADLRVEARVRNGDGADPSTLAAARETVSLKEHLFDETHVEVATSFRNLGVVLIATAEYGAARETLQRAARILDAPRPANERLLADVLHDLGDAEIRTEQFDAAERSLVRALKLRERDVETPGLLVAQTLERIGYLQLQRGKYSAAREPLTQALAAAEKQNPSHPDTAAVLNTLGTLSWFEGDVAGSEHYYRRALELASKTLGPDHPSTAMYLRDLSTPLWEMGRTSEARELRREALSLGQSRLGNTHPEVAWQLNDLANSQLELGDYSDARRLYEEALAVVNGRFGPTHLNTATVLHNLALLEAHLGNTGEAIRQLQQAEAIWQRVLGPTHPYVGLALDSLAQVFREQGRYGEARSLLERALAVREAAHGREHREVAESLVNLATVVLRSGASVEAQPLIERACNILEKAGSTKEPLYATLLVLRGEALGLAGNYDRARADLDAALARRTALFGSAHPLVAATKGSLAAALLGLGRNADAVRLALEAESTSREHLRLTARYLSEHESVAYASSRKRGLDLALSATQFSALENDALFDAVIRSRALILDEMSTRLAAVRGRQNSELERELSLVVTARERLASLLVRGAVTGESTSNAETLLDARREVEAAERQLAAKSADFRSELGRQQAGLRDVRRTLPSDAALVSFVRYDRINRRHQDHGAPAYMAFVLDHPGAAPVAVNLGSAVEIEALIERWRREIAPGALKAERGPSQAEHAYRAVGLALRRRLWDPLVGPLGAKTRVLIVPDGAINLVSFAALPLDSRRYLAEGDRVLHYLAAERDMLWPAQEQSRVASFLALGGPDFGTPSSPTADTLPSAGRPQPSGSASPRSTDPCRGLDAIEFTPLSESAREALEVEAIWKRTMQAGSTVLTGQQASERALKQSVAGSRIVHLATHGFFLASRCFESSPTTRGVGGLAPATEAQANPLQLSGLAFAGANERAQHTREDDGVLTADEVAGLDLRNAQWVVLSACDTGVGEVKVGEGVLGLRRAFQIAGARTVIMSLWAVEDLATREWMRALYEARLGRSFDTARSVRQAQIDVIQARRAAAQSTHPFYWASFVAVGDWR